MMRKYQFAWFLLIAFLMPSCEFKCNVGEIKDERKTGEKSPVVKEDGTLLYNDIELTANKVKVKKAYLLFADGTRVPANNVIDFKQPVKLVIVNDGGWLQRDNKVKLGASEKAVLDNGETILEEEDLFKDVYDNGIPAEEANVISLTITFTPTGSSGPGYVKNIFRVWDKQGDGYVEGSYRLYSK